MKKLITFFALILILTANLKAQVSGIPFTQSSGGYSEISGGTVLINTNTWDDESFTTLPIGFSFTYNSTAYTTFSLNANGFIVPGNTVVSSYGALCDGVQGNVIAALAGDIRSHTNRNQVSDFRCFSKPDTCCSVEKCNNV